jgi:hydroxymethylglutaryl-CoA reductase
MTRRGGGILDIHLKDLSDRIGRYYQLEVIFNTVDSMGANFINSCLERMAEYFQHQAVIHNVAQNLEIIMSILSNYTPECLVECTVSCPITDLDQQPAGISGPDFARRFGIAVDMAHHDVYRAATHNKGIYNGIDAVMLATGNDSRAAEASGHSYASAGGMYRGLTHARISGDTFTFSLKMPLPLGTVGGITRTHPMAEISLSLLQYPDAEKLMGIAAAAGLANNYSAVRALVTSGIQHGHMWLHLTNLLIHLGASEQEMTGAREFFRHRIVTHAGVEDFLRDLRKKSQGWSQE